MQHEWADLFEKLADLVGREIRYDDTPQFSWVVGLEELRAARPEFGEVLDETLAQAYDVKEKIATVVEIMITLSDQIATWETETSWSPEARMVFKRALEEALTNLLSVIRSLPNLAGLPWADTLEP